MANRTAGRLLSDARRRSSLRQAAMAREAGMPRSVVNAYERGHRQPGVDALAKLLRAAGYELRLGRIPVVDPERAGRVLAQVLDLAEALPTRRRGPLRYPVFGRRAA